MGFDAPHSPAPTTDERELLLGFIRWQREQVVATADGLTDEQMWWTPGDDHLLAIGAILNHLTHMEWRWIEGRYGGAEFPARTDEFARDPALTRAVLVEAYAAQAERTAAMVRGADLDAPCLGIEGGRGPAHELLGFETPLTLRWVLLHVLEETAHHAGHADATRELLDGRRMRA
jgi:Protein of unknown function (DUF664)